MPSDTVKALQRRTAVDAERLAVVAEIDAEAAERLRELAPDLLDRAEDSIRSTAKMAKAARERADALRDHAKLTDADYPSLRKDLEDRLEQQETALEEATERAAHPQLYATADQVRQPGFDAEVTFRWEAVNTEANVAALKARLAAMPAPNRATRRAAGERGTPADKPPTA